MKRIGYLYEKVISLENLRLADEKARIGKKKTFGVIQHDKNKDSNLYKLHEQLKNHTYKTSKYFVFRIYEPKERIIYRLPYYPDRIVHHAIMNILEPIWVKTFTYNTYSCVKHRGIDACAKRIRKIIDRHKGKKLYCLKIDIKKFYPSVDHDVLKRIVRKKIKDPELLWLIDSIIDSTGTPTDLPIGNYLSLYLSNLILCYFMHSMNEKWCKECTEYADDFCFFSESKQELHSLLHNIIIPTLEGELKFKLKNNYLVFPIAKNCNDKHGRGLDYIGYVFYMDHTMIRKRIKKNFAKKVKWCKLNNLCKKSAKQQLCSWFGFALRTSSRNLIKKLNIKQITNHEVFKQRKTRKVSKNK